jgi:hypothetical protein
MAKASGWRVKYASKLPANAERRSAAAIRSAGIWPVNWLK